jgi:hypothetical protein
MIEEVLDCLLDGDTTAMAISKVSAGAGVGYGRTRVASEILGLKQAMRELVRR